MIERSSSRPAYPHRARLTETDERGGREFWRSTRVVYTICKLASFMLYIWHGCSSLFRTHLYIMQYTFCGTKNRSAGNTARTRFL